MYKWTENWIQIHMNDLGLFQRYKYYSFNPSVRSFVLKFFLLIYSRLDNCFFAIWMLKVKMIEIETVSWFASPSWILIISSEKKPKFHLQFAICNFIVLLNIRNLNFSSNTKKSFFNFVHIKRKCEERSMKWFEFFFVSKIFSFWSERREIDFAASQLTINNDLSKHTGKKERKKIACKLTTTIIVNTHSWRVKHANEMVWSRFKYRNGVQKRERNKRLKV